MVVITKLPTGIPDPLLPWPCEAIVRLEKAINVIKILFILLFFSFCTGSGLTTLICMFFLDGEKQVQRRDRRDQRWIGHFCERGGGIA